MTTTHASAPVAPTADEARATIASLTWTIETYLPSELRATTHARRVASLRRQLVEAEAARSRAVSDLGAAVQEGR